MTQQFQELQRHYEELQSQNTNLVNLKNIASGARGMGTLLNDPAIKSALPTEWKDVFASIKSTATYAEERAKYPTSTYAKTNELYDTEAANKATMTEFFKKANGRLAQVQSLMNQIDLANDPAAKADLQNRLVSEQNAITATSQLLSIVEKKQAQDLEAANKAAVAEWRCKSYKRAGC